MDYSLLKCLQVKCKYNIRRKVIYIQATTIDVDNYVYLYLSRWKLNSRPTAYNCSLVYCVSIKKKTFKFS